MINVFEPSTGDAELAALAAVLDSKWIGCGQGVKAFEAAFGRYIECPADELTAVSCATEGLFHAMPALGIGPGDDVVLPSASFVGAAHAVHATGARVVLSDVDPLTLNPSASDVERALTPATKAVVLLHYGGEPGAVAELAGLLRARSILLIEDAAIGLGSFVNGRACGTFGDVGVWSFDSMKTLTTGDGGIVWCRSAEHVEAIRRSTMLGGAAAGFARREVARWWELDPSSPGRRAIMNDLAAAIGLVQLERLNDFLERREQIAQAYEAGLRELSWLRVQPRSSSTAARSFSWIQTAPELRDHLAQHLLEAGIYTTFKYWPLHRMTLYHRAEHDFPGAERAAASTLLLPLHQGLRDADVERVIQVIHAFETDQ